MTDIADQEPLPSEDTIPEEPHDPHQFDDAPDIESDPILDYINSQYHQEEDMTNALQAYNVMTSPTSDVTPQQSINAVHIFKQNTPNMVHLLIGEQWWTCRVRCQSPVQILQEMHCYWYRPTPDQWSGHCAMCCTGQHLPWLCQPHHE